MDIDIQGVLSGYLACALWTASDEHGEPLDKDFEVGDFHEESRSQASATCAAFCEQNAQLLADMEPSQIGHDLWLTRNGHGAGFWDRGLGEAGDELTKSASALGETGVSVISGYLFLDN